MIMHILVFSSCHIHRIDSFSSYRTLSHLLNSKFLHSAIREQGGAYGGGSGVSPGRFAFYSYRDPSADATLKLFEESLDFALTNDFTEQALTEAKLSVFQELDCPVSAGARGLQAFLTGIDDEKRQAHRELLFAVDEAAVKKAAQQLKRQLEQSVQLGRAVLGPKETSKWKQTSDWSVLDLLQKRIRSTYEHVYRELFCRGEGSDITVSALGRDWALHRIYIKQSPFFAAMLEGGWKESESNRIILELSDENITHEALHVVFGSFYLDSVTLSDQVYHFFALYTKTVLSILAAATWFHLEDIRRLCSDFLRRTVRLDTLIDLYTIAGKYNLPELSQTCVNWLSQKLLVLPDTPVFFSLLKRIPIPLMHSVVRHPKLVVIQLEQDVFICLLKVSRLVLVICFSLLLLVPTTSRNFWLYLQHHPDKEYCPAAQLLKEAYQYYTTTEAGFLESPDGAAYAAVFRGVRWEHVVSIYKATQRIVQDRIVPRVWLLEAFQRQWMQLLLSHEAQCSTSSTHHHHHHAGTLRSTAANATFLAAYLSPRLNGDAARHQQTSASSDGRELPGPPSDLPDSLFWRHSERFGRWMSSGEHTCSWRWTGYHFGVDILIKYRRRWVTCVAPTSGAKAFHVIRLTDAASAEGSVCRAREHRLKISMSVLSAPSEETATPTADAAANSDASATDSSASEDASSVGCLGDDWEVCGWPGGSRVCFSGLKTFDMLENASYEVVRLPDDFAFPAVVSANILRYDPVQMLSGLVDDDAGAPAL
ncbi:unnamed protein product [Mesocestoides corti]|uniref:BTB domain-containing protein n=2 Tax=Mesocestoides corti TaxID=53468 RepID=A0A158QSJ4_MESCO|nr:unnamed protein product [Mesocestoides corti]